MSVGGACGAIYGGRKQETEIVLGSKTMVAPFYIQHFLLLPPHSQGYQDREAKKERVIKGSV
jgi:hypothetical protein